MDFDESTIRKKLSEYEKLGLIEISREGNKSVYSMAKQNEFPSQLQNALDFASEILPIGIIGSTLLDKLPEHDNAFSFKHHYISQVMDSEIMLEMFLAMQKKCWVQILTLNERKNKKENPRGTTAKILPLKIISSSRTGRQYVIAHVIQRKKMKAFRLDNILEVMELEECKEFDILRRRLKEAEKYCWGASFGDFEHLQTVEFSVKFRVDEEYIYKRLLREKRYGTIELISKNEAKFYVQVWDVREMRSLYDI